MCRALVCAFINLEKAKELVFNQNNGYTDRNTTCWGTDSFCSPNQTAAWDEDTFRTWDNKLLESFR